MGTDKKGTQDGEQLGAAGGAYQGPTYFDVRAASAHLEASYPIRVHFDVRPVHITQRWSGTGLWVRAVAYSISSSEYEYAAAGSQLGGYAGAKTLPGAMMQALYHLEDALIERVQTEYEAKL